MKANQYWPKKNQFPRSLKSSVIHLHLPNTLLPHMNHMEPCFLKPVCYLYSQAVRKNNSLRCGASFRGRSSKHLFVTWKCASAHLFTFLAINCAPTKAKNYCVSSFSARISRNVGRSLGCFLLQQHKPTWPKYPFNHEKQEVLAPAKRFSPNFLLFFSSAYFLSSSAPFRIFRRFTVGTNCLPCCLPAPVISTTCFYHASAVQL